MTRKRRVSERKVTFGNERKRASVAGGNGLADPADEMEWRGRTNEQGERTREAGRKGRRIVYSNEGVNK